MVRILKSLSSAIFLLLILVIPASGFTTEQIKGDIDELQNWFTYYYMHPEPDKTPKMMKFLMQKPETLLDESAFPLVAFLSQVFKQNPNKIKEWIHELNPNNKQKAFIWIILKNSGISNLEDYIKPKNKFEMSYFKRINTFSPYDFEHLEPTDTNDLDGLWGCFLATGNTNYVRSIINVLRYPEKDDKSINLVVAAANWSIRANARQHKKVLELCKTVLKEKNHHPNIIAELKDIVKDL